jgi:hypothetical protein
LLPGWQILQQDYSAELAHAVFGRLAHHLPGQPKAESAVLLERRHHAHRRTAVAEERHAPLQAFLDFRAGGVDQLAQVLDDRSGEVGGLRDIGIEAWIAVRHGLPHRSRIK